MPAVLSDLGLMELVLAVFAASLCLLAATAALLWRDLARARRWCAEQAQKAAGGGR